MHDYTTTSISDRIEPERFTIHGYCNKSLIKNNNFQYIVKQNE